jgi:hypothetical protein
MWNGTIGKTVTLDYFSNRPKIIRWTTTIAFPSPVPPGPKPDLELVTAYLNGNFNKIYMYNVPTKILTSITIPDGSCIDPQNNSIQRITIGGAIIATSTGNYALGVFHNGPLESYEGYFLCNSLVMVQVVRQIITPRSGVFLSAQPLHLAVYPVILTLCI